MVLTRKMSRSARSCQRTGLVSPRTREGVRRRRDVSRVKSLVVREPVDEGELGEASWKRGTHP